MKILITAIHHPIASGRYVHDALVRQGHEVRSAGPAMGNRLWNLTVDDQYIWTPNPPAKKWQPDLVVHMDSQWCPLDLNRVNCPVVVYGVDNHLCDYQFDGVVFDHLFLAHGHGLRIGEENVTWLPCGYDPAWFQPGPEHAQRPDDLALIGWLNPARNTLIAQISAHFAGALRFRYDSGLIYDHYAAAYQGAKMSLVLSVNGDVAQRVFETAAMGCLLLMDDTHDGEALGLAHGENCVQYPRGDTAQLVQLLQYALDNPTWTATVALAGQQWAGAHTWDVRVQAILDWVKTHNGQQAEKETK